MAHPHAAGLSRTRAAWLLGMSWALIAPSWSADGIDGQRPAISEAARPLVEFDIPAQPLEDALKRYATLTRRATLFRSEIVAGRRSATLHGRYAPEEALRRLLDGTGLSIEQVHTGQAMAFVLKAGDVPAVLPRPGLEVVPGGADYPTLVQAGVWRALCADPRTAPGEYRSLLRVQVDAAGMVERPRLLRSTGDPRRDAAMLVVVQRVRLERPPPPDMPQPITLLILPREPGVSEPVQYCDPHAGGAAS